MYVALTFVTYIFNMLKMNRDKTELLVLNGRQRPLPPLTTISVCDEEINRSTKARNVGVIYDSSLSMENHIMAICKAAFFHLRNISRIRKYLSTQMAEMLVHAFASSRFSRLLQLAIVWFSKGIAKEITARSKCCSQDCYA